MISEKSISSASLLVFVAYDTLSDQTYFHFQIFNICIFQKSNEDQLTDLVLCFNNFSTEIKAHKNRNCYFLLP